MKRAGRPVRRPGTGSLAGEAAAGGDGRTSGVLAPVWDLVWHHGSEDSFEVVDPYLLNLQNLRLIHCKISE